MVALGDQGSARLAALRAELARLKLDAFLIPSDDPHQSEYVRAVATIRARACGPRRPTPRR